MVIAESRDTSVIETVERIREADPGDMLSRIKDLPKQVRDAWAIASKATIAPAYSDVRNIVVAGLVLGVLSKLGFVRDLSDDIEAALSDLAKLEERVHEGARTNDAKRMALELQGRIPFAYGAGVMGVMARRVKGQWNENAKNWSAFDVMSELNHNAVVGFENPTIAKDALTVLLLRSDRDNPRHKLRFEITRELLDRARIPHKTLQFAGRNMLSEILQMVYFTDYVSFYIALLNGADPSPVKSIDYLKDRLAKGN